MLRIFIYSAPSEDTLLLLCTYLQSHDQYDDYESIMKLIYIIPYFLLLFILPLTHAIPSGEPQRFYDWDGSSHRGECLNDEQADKILKNWISFFVQADPVLINKTVSPTFHFYSGTSNFIQQYGANKGVSHPCT